MAEQYEKLEESVPTEKSRSFMAFYENQDKQVTKRINQNRIHETKYQMQTVNS